MNSPLLAQDFAPYTEVRVSERIEKPSHSYWQHVWLRLRAHKSAMASLVILIFLAIFALFGDFFWTVDPNHQDLQQISQAPYLQRKALVVNDLNVHQAIVQPTKTNANTATQTQLFSAPQNLRIVGQANTEQIVIRWEAVATATGYKIYRHELQPSNQRDLGLPIAEINSAEIVSFADGLALETISYFYSVVAIKNTNGRYPTEVSDASTIKATAVPAIKISDAKKLLDTESAAKIKIGDKIALKAHPLGTDSLGRDMLARLIQGAKVSLFIGFVAPFIYIIIGTIYGGISGYLGGKIDNIMMRFADFIIALPFLLFMILFKVIFGIGPGESGITPMLFAMILLSWPSSARLVRGQTLQIREEAYIQAARMMGARPTYLLRAHIFPNVISVLLVSISFAIPSAIFTEAFLSFIGMGVVPPTPSWGSMCNDGIQSMLSHPHELLFPAMLISITVLAFNLLGDGLRDAFDVKTNLNH